MAVRILLAENHVLMRQALRALLTTDNDISIVAEADDGSKVHSLAELTNPDIVIMDVSMPNMNGIEATRLLTEKHPKSKIIALSAYQEQRYVKGMLEAGARGYLIKTESEEELFQAIQMVLKGQIYLSPMVRSYLETLEKVGSENGKQPLTKREKQVITLLAQGLHSPEIAKSLGISSATVEVHRRNIMRKLNLRGIAELTKYAVREGLVSA